MARLETQLREILGEIVETGDIEPALEFVKNEINVSFKNGIATAKYDTKRKTTLPEVKRRAFARQR